MTTEDPKLSDLESLVLDAISRLGDAVSINMIFDEIETITGKTPRLNRIYEAIKGLVTVKLIGVELSDSIPARGGRKKKMASLTPKGKQFLSLHVEHGSSDVILQEKGGMA